MYFKLVIRKGTARLIVSSDSEDDRYDTLEYAEGSIAGSTWSRSGREDVVVWLAKGCPEPPPASDKTRQSPAAASFKLGRIAEDTQFGLETEKGTRQDGSDPPRCPTQIDETGCSQFKPKRGRGFPGDTLLIRHCQTTKV